MKKPMGDWKLTAGLAVLVLLALLLAATGTTEGRARNQAWMDCGMTAACFDAYWGNPQ